MSFKNDAQRKAVMRILGAGYRSRGIGETQRHDLRDKAFLDYGKRYGFKEADAHEVIRFTVPKKILQHRAAVGEFLTLQPRLKGRKEIPGVTLYGAERRNRFDMGQEYTHRDMARAILEAFRRSRTRTVAVFGSPHNFVVRKFKGGK